MIHDTIRNSPVLLSSEDEDEVQFEPTLTAHAPSALENRDYCEEDGELVRDDELLSCTTVFVSPDPFPPLRQNQSATSSSTSSSSPYSTVGVGEAPRRVVPPPLKTAAEYRSDPPLQAQIPTFHGRAPQSPTGVEEQPTVAPIFAGRPTQLPSALDDRPPPFRDRLPAFGDQLVEPVTSVHRVTRVARSAESLSRMADGSAPDPRRPQRKELLREGDILLGKLRIERVVSEGLLVTAQAVHLGVGTRAQVVLLSPHGRGFADAQERFVRTARIVAHMQSEHVARVTDVGTLESGAPFLVTEMLGYSDLSEVLRARGPIAVSDAIDYTVQIAEALAEAHSLGIIHGNLRPASIRLSEGIDGWPLVKVAGYGAMAQWSLSSVSVRANSRRNASGNSVLPYLSPEQIRSPDDLDARTDLWSLGAVLHEMLVGWPVFQADSTAALLAMIAADPPPRISSLRSELPRQLETVILRCLEKDRSARFASVAELTRSLQPFAPPECLATIERIARVTARSSAAPTVHGRPQTAMVHVRSHGAPQPSYARASTVPSVPPLRLGIIVGAVVLLGAAAGVSGAMFASQLGRSAHAVDKVSDSEKRAANEPREAPTVAANSIKDTVPAIAASPANTTSIVTSASTNNPSNSAVMNPGNTREASRPTAAIQRRPPVIPATTLAPRKETRLDTGESHPTAKTADLFGDIK